MTKFLPLLSFAAFVVIVPCLAFAQEENIQYSYGTVTSVNVDNKEIVVSEYNWENETSAEIKVTYSVTENTEFENVKSLADIKSGDQVSIEYSVDQNGAKTAKFVGILKEETPPEPAKTEPSAGEGGVSPVDIEAGPAVDEQAPAEVNKPAETSQ